MCFLRNSFAVYTDGLSGRVNQPAESSVSICRKCAKLSFSNLQVCRRGLAYSEANTELVAITLIAQLCLKQPGNLVGSNAVPTTASSDSAHAVLQTATLSVAPSALAFWLCITINA